jgi:uncharacterized protein YuzE
MMKVYYDSETDSLYIDLSKQPGVDASEVAPGIVLDFDEAGKAVGIDIQRASTIVDLNRLDTEFFPVISPEQSTDSASPDR